MICCVSSFLVVVCKWKVALTASTFLLMLLMVFIASCCHLVWWILSLQFNLALDPLVRECLEVSLELIPMFGIFVIAVVLTLNWAFALLDVYGVNLSTKTERLCLILTSSCIASFFVFMIVSGYVWVFSRYQRSLLTSAADHVSRHVLVKYGYVVLHFLSIMLCYVFC